jgi:hypothetical protein
MKLDELRKHLRAPDLESQAEPSTTDEATAPTTPKKPLPSETKIALLDWARRMAGHTTLVGFDDISARVCTECGKLLDQDGRYCEVCFDRLKNTMTRKFTTPLRTCTRCSESFAPDDADETICISCELKR